MRVPLSWLREMVDFDLEPEQLAQRLTLLGMEVKGIERRGTDWNNVVVGELLAVEKHPRADRLQLTRVNVGEGEPLEIVCGATNIAPGQRVPVALPGAVLPGDRRIERTEKMGVVSNGMLCSGDELGLTADSDGILILDPGTPLGARLTDLYGDVVLDVDVKPNRGDALSIVGIAREVAAVTGSEVRMPPTDVAEDPASPITERLRVRVEDEGLCPRFVGRWVEGVRVGPSPDWVQMRLLAAGIRPISNVVDASNYVMVELGKPIHTFDAGKVATRDGLAEIVVRLAQPGERLETLDHVDRELTADTLLIADPERALGIAGVMGGASSEVSEATTSVIVESAIFDPVSIRRTAFRYALRSDASLRFEKGQEFRLARVGADRATRLVAEWAGGTVATGAVDSHPEEPAARLVRFRPTRINQILGTNLRREEQQGVLARVGIVAAYVPDPDPTAVVVARDPLLVAETSSSDALAAAVPTWRRDIDIEADIVEEVARIFGYESVPPRTPATPMPSWRETPLMTRDAIRAALAGAGLNEAVTYALVSPRMVESFAWSFADRPAAGESAREGTPITVVNPLSADHSVLRQSIVGSLVQVVDTNVRHGQQDVFVFEVGKGYGRLGDDTREWWRLGLALSGAFEAPAWNRTRREADLGDAKGAIALIAGLIGAGEPSYATLTDEPLLHPGRSASVESRLRTGEPAITGVVGELHPRVADAWELRGRRVIVAELSIAGLGGGSLPIVGAEPLPRFQPVERDLTVDVPDRVPAAEVATRLQNAGGDLLEHAALVGQYRGHPLGPDERSLTFRLRFAAAERALTDDDVDGAISTITAALADHVGARIRS